jgi:ribosomal-protein-alanine N-acetyltransferase
MTLALRRMRWWDVERVLSLERRLFPQDGWNAEQFWSELAGVPASRHYVVAELAAGDHPSPAGGPALLGYAGLFATRHTADVQTVAVDPNAQGAGVGAALLTALLDEARGRGVGEVLLEVRADNEAAQRLYARHGFERIGVRRAYYQPGGVDALVLRKRGWETVRP